MFTTNFDETTKLWSGLDIPSIYDGKKSMGEMILQALQVNATKVAQINAETNVRMTFDEIYRKTVRAALHLQRLGLGQTKQIFGIMSEYSDDAVPIIFATICIGCSIQMLSTSYSRAELYHLFQICKPKVMFCDANIYETIAEHLDELDSEIAIFTFSGQVGRSIPIEQLFYEIDGEEQFTPTDVDVENDTAVMFCSSGTTGLPKGACVSHAALLDQTTRWPFIQPTDVFLCFCPMFWQPEMIISATLYGATRIFSSKLFSPELLLQSIEQYKVTLVQATTHQFLLTLNCRKLQQTNMSSVRHFFAAGSKLSQHPNKEMNKYLPNGTVQTMYGMSELGGYITSYCEYNCNENVGKLLSGCQVKIINENGNRLGCNEMGEICIKTTFAFLGYYGDPVSTNAAIDSEGFILSGDIGYFDKNGFLNVINRKKDFFKYTHYIISPTEIESFLSSCKDVKVACVVGVTDALVGHLPAAVIVLKNGSTITEFDIQRLVSDCKRLRGGVYFVGGLFTNSTGKIQRDMVKELALKLYNERMVKLVTYREDSVVKEQNRKTQIAI